MFRRAFSQKKSHKVRVVIVTDSMQPWNFGGKEERLRHLQNASLESHESEFEIIYATMKWWDDEAPANHIAISKLRPMYYKERRSIRQAILFALSCLKVIRLRPDIIEADQIPILQLYVIKLVAKLTRASFSVTWHEVWDANDWHEYIGYFGWLAWRLEVVAMKLPDQIIAVSAPTRFKLIHAGVPESMIDLIEPDIDRNGISRATTKLPASDILFAGRMIGNKNLDLVLKAMALLANDGILVTASMVGDGPDLEKLVNLTSELKLQSQVTFHGFLSRNDDVWGLMKKCAIFVSPSTREGFGFSVMEAYFAGASLVIADHPNNAATYYLNDLENVTLVKVSSPQAYAQAIKDRLPNLRSVTNSDEVAEITMYSRYEKSWGKLIAKSRSAS